MNIDCVCIIDKEGIISYMSNEFHYSTGLRMSDCIFDHIDNTIDDGNEFINKINNIQNQNYRFDLYPINHHMITPDGWNYTLDVMSIMFANTYISMIIKDVSLVRQRLLTNPVYRIRYHFIIPIKALVIDDSITTCHVMKRLIEQDGIHNCNIESDSTNVLDINIEEYDLFIFDINMPGYSGTNLIEMIKGNPRLKSNAKFTAISTDDSLELVQQCLDKGFDLFLPKPLNRFKVLNLIETYKTISLNV